MKHFNQNGMYRRMQEHAKVSLSVFSVNQPIYFIQPLLVLVLMLSPATVQWAVAQTQCTLNCEYANVNEPLERTVDENCQALLEAAAFLDPWDICDGDKRLTLRDATNTIIAEGTNSLSADASGFIGQTLALTITDVSTTLFCISYVRFVDAVPPVIYCAPVNISCIADTSAASVGIPDIFDNCGNDITSSYEDVYVAGNCSSPGSGLINRIWTAVDASDNATVCTQTIFLNKPDLTAVQFPPDYQLSCDDPASSPVATGRPTLDGTIIESGQHLCSIDVSFSDDTTFVCGFFDYEIDRTWTVSDPCTDQVVTGNQTITVRDEVAPTVSCPSNITVDTDPGGCLATVFLPLPSYSDNCVADPDYTIHTSWGGTGQGPHTNVPVGVHSIVYTIFDECGNANSCTIALTVRDVEEPTVICEQNTIVSIPSPGIGIVMAENFDSGSYDNCSDNLWFKARKMNAGSCDFANGDDSNQAGQQEWFDDMVIFCCEEAGGADVMVILRVYDIDPGDGPVDPSREVEGGDLHNHYTDCMVSVEVQDKIAPAINCPANLTIDCDDSYGDLSTFGTVTGTDNCGYDLTETVHENISDCGVGTISRVFTATDDSGNSSTCTQTISVDNLTPFSENQIDWPNDYVTDNCTVLTDPDYLPTGFDRPVVDDNACGIISVAYEDDLFDVSYPACYKILRTWTVLDWCEYEPEYPENGGRFTKIQVIKVIDNEAPVVECPEPVTVPVGPDCDFGYVEIPLPTAEDCNPNILITHDSDYADDLTGANASGYYPLGTTPVTFRIADQCGNLETCVVNVTVEDLTAPGAVCIVGLSVNLSNEEEGIRASIDAIAFDGSSVDNCTPEIDLVRTIRRAENHSETAPTTTSITFTCEDAGLQLIEFWVTDAVGNSDYCTTYIAVQDNNEICPSTTTITSSGMVAGGVSMESGETVQNVIVELTTTVPQAVTTTEDGHFEFPDIPMGSNFTLRPHRNDDTMNGVSTLDLVLITRHILGVAPLDSPYKIIAADADRSGGVSTLDIVRIRRLILQIDDALPNNNTSWRFIPGNFEFPDPTNPFDVDFPEEYTISDFHEEHMDVQFVAIKVGDVNTSATASAFMELDERDAPVSLMLETQNQQLQAEQEIEVPFYASDLRDLNGYQFTINFDPQVLEFIDTKTGEIESISSDNFGFKHVSEGFITTSWNGAVAISNQSNTHLFSLKFRILETTDLASSIGVSSRLTNAEAYFEEEPIRTVELRYTDENNTTLNTETDFKLYQNRPNPFKNTTTIAFEIPYDEVMNLTIVDITGRILYQNTQACTKGYNELEIRRDVLDVEGIVYYKLSSTRFTATKRMIVLD